MKRLQLGTRKSPLAMAQALEVRDNLAKLWPSLTIEVVPMTTAGDRDLKTSLTSVADKGFFTAAIEQSLIDGTIDIAVHSLKDLPTLLEEPFIIGAYSQREDARDALISRRGQSFESLPEKARLGTSSLRRKAQLHSKRPDVVCEDLRGNLQTRLAKFEADESWDGIVLAMAGLHRMGLTDRVTEIFDFETLLPAPGQGVIAVECLQDRPEVLELLAPMNHQPSADAALAERTFLAALGGGCQTPLGTYCCSVQEGLKLSAKVLSVDGSQMVAVEVIGDDPLSLGAVAARRALDQGAGVLLAASDTTSDEANR